MESNWLSSSWTHRLMKTSKGKLCDTISQKPDFQGTFDYRTTVRENMTVFALSTMTSSGSIFLLMHQNTDCRPISTFVFTPKHIENV